MSYTCVSCGLEFQDASIQREHMKSEWHRYNLKRRVAQLPSIDEITFNLKIASLASNENSKDEANSKKQMTKKGLRKKQKESLEAQKKKLLAAREALQKSMVSNVNQDSDESTISERTQDTANDSNRSEIQGNPQGKEAAESSDNLEEVLIAEKLANRVEIPLTTCLFCPSKSNSKFETLQENLNHMFKKHGLYIPERKYLVDEEGLITYLGEKIGLGNVCLKCSFQGRTIEAVREHMNSKRHMVIPYESEEEKLEISDFYDFSSTYSNEFPSESDTNEDDWEDLSDNEADSSEEEVGTDALYNTGAELVLPSGAIIGHRSMAKYYKQNLPPPKVLSEGQGTVIAAESRHFAASGNKEQLAISKRAWAHQKKREDVNDRRAAKFINNQPHYRDQLLQ